MKKSTLDFKKAISPTAVLREMKPGMSVKLEAHKVKTNSLRTAAYKLKKEGYQYRISCKQPANEILVERLQNKTVKKDFKKETYSSLNIYEQNILLPILVKTLKTKKGESSAITAKQIVEGLQSYGVKLNLTNVFRTIYYIRMNDLIVGLMGSKSGYYVISSEEDFIKYENLLLSREVAVRKVRMSIKRQRIAKSLQAQAQSLKQTVLF